ncbi:hypothetical protein [Streptomyces sp. NPDC094468]|uniref:hypothetical protein n=1 Tax=Streptomyces sp. NPDC094468 TaxID=3366066 RepID=UPI0037F3B27C
MPRHPIALRLAGPLAVLALAVSACSSSDGPAGAARPATTQAKPSPSTPAALAAGDSVSGKVKEDHGTVTYGVSALRILYGTQAQAKAAVQDPADAKGKVLAVAHVRYVHQAGPTLTSSTNADDSTTVWADGHRAAILLGSPTDSADPYAIASWPTGQSHTICEYYLVPASAKKAQVHWTPDGNGTPYVWSFPGPGA